jgi:proteasome lid subunit RPN8/RPN11
MTTNQIRLEPTKTHQPRPGNIPYRRAWRWCSPHEGAEADSGLDVFMTQGAYVRACAHAGSDLNNEVGGWLLGKWRFDKRANRQFIVIEKIMPAPYVRHGRAYLTFTQDSQVAMHDALEGNHPGKEVVGWYHTHPRMGVFLSRYDTWLHQNFFPKPWQVALVIEPHTANGGFFIPDPEGQLDPFGYTGFYELINRAGRSVVHWENLSCLAGHNHGGAQHE